MASGPAASIAACESSEVAEESPAGKKKSRFQTFKNFFAKKKRKEAASPVADDGVLKTGQSSDDVNTAEPVSILTDQDSDSGSNIKLENKALSQDSVFASDSPCSETNEVLGASQDCIHGKVKSLQLQLKQTIRLSCPTGSGRQAEESTTLSEDDGLPYSPLEDSSFNAGPAASSQRSSGVGQRTGSLSLEGSDTDDDQMSNGASSRPSTPQATIPVDFSDPASSLSCLDSSAARHRIAVNTRACAKRKPASREMLQTKKRDLRGRVLLRDTEDKMRAAGEFTEGEENQANVSEDTEEEVDTLDESSLLEQTEEEPPTSTRSQTSSRTSAVVECSEEEEGVLHKDHNPGMEFSESSWEGPVTLELQADDFLLDTGCDGASEEQGSLLEEVLSSLKGPLTSGLVLEPSDVIEEMEVEDATVEYVPDILAEDTSTNLLDFTDRSLTLEEQIMPDDNTLFKTAEYLNEVEDTSENEEEPVKHEFSEETPHEDSQVCEGEAEYDHEEEEKQDKRKDVGEEVYEVSEEEPEKENMEENRKEEVGWENKEDEENYVDEAEKMLDEDSTEEVAEETMEDEREQGEESGINDEACPPEKELEINVNKTTIEDECFHDSNQCVQVEALDSMEVLNQPEDHPESPAHETAELPSFVVATSVDLSFASRVSDIPKQIKEREDKTETLQEEACEPHVILERLQDWTSGSPQLADEHQVAQEMMSNSRPQFTITPAWQKSLSGGTVKELSQPVEPSAADEPAFMESTSSDHPLDDVKAEQSSSPFQSRSAPPLPLPRETCQAQEETTPENPFGVRLRKTPVLHRYAFEGENPAPATQTDAAETQKTILEQLARKPALPKKPDQVIESAMKPRRSSDLVVGKTSLENSEAPSWISVARQKQKVFKENCLEESFESKVSDEEFKSDLSSPVTKDVSSLLKPVASPVKVACSLEMSKTSVVEKESKKTASHMPPAPLAHEEPPWLALAKKKAKAWSEMPQIVQ